MVIHMVIKNVGKTQPQSRESTPTASTTTGTSAAAANAPTGAAPPPPPFGDPQLGGMGAMFNNPMVWEMLNSPFMERFVIFMNEWIKS